MPDYSKMTQEELDKEIEKTYGKDWNLEDLDTESELFAAFIETISTGK